MIKYSGNTINDWYCGASNLIKVYRNGAVIYQYIGVNSPSGQTPCFAVVDDITQYQDRTYEDVFNNADSSWYKLNNLNNYEKYGVYGSGRTITYYDGKLTIDEVSTSRLPTGYTEVEYIENTGTSYINTNLQLCSATTNTFTVEAKLTPNLMDAQTYQNIFACMSEAREPYQGFTYRYQFSTISPTFIPSEDGSFTEVDNQDGTTSVTATSLNGLTYSHDYPLTICCGLDANRDPFRFTATKIYTFKVTLNNQLVADYVPAMRNSDNEYGLYDLITNTFYTSPNGNNFVGGSPVTSTTATCEFIYSGDSWVNLGEVSGSTASLPNVPFTINYNAKNYDSQTQTLAKTSGQLANTDAVITAGTPTIGNGYLTITGNTQANISGYQQYFNRNSNNPNLTIVSKQMTDGYSCHMFANRENNYNWMYRPYSDHLTLHGLMETGGIDVSTQPVIESVRVNSNNEVIYNNYTDNTTSSITDFSYGSENTDGNTALFAGYAFNSGGEWFVGDFYWVYMSQNTLTDEQIQQVIDYNEGGGGEAVYPEYYDEIQDPPDNVVFTSMTQAESYECPWVGMTATISGTDYMFCDSNTWMTKYVYSEVSGDYICDGGNKYKKMQQYDRNIDGTTSAHVPPIYVKGDLIESGSTDCGSRLPEGYTEVEYIENTGTSYLDTNIVVSEDYKIETEMEQVTEMEYGRLFGCGYWSYTDGLQFAFQGAEGYKCIHMHFLGSSGWDYNTSYKYDTLKHTYTYDNCTFSVDGVEAGSHSPSSIQPTDTMGVFTYIFNDRPSDSSYWGYEHTQAKMYSFKIWNGSGTLVSDLVPCIRISDNTVGAYDIVNDTFLYPSTTYTQDSFVAGPQV